MKCMAESEIINWEAKMTFYSVSLWGKIFLMWLESIFLS